MPCHTSHRISIPRWLRMSRPIFMWVINFEVVSDYETKRKDPVNINGIIRNHT